ncbi:MAG: acyltransferase [Cetobacterium sp.]|uniref:acyltransferase n=1 Tax=Cetobacterium sp. TaxID=2071632 RepID=UPI003F32F587
MKNLFNTLILKLFKKGKKLYTIEKQNKLRKKYNLHDTFSFNGDNILFYGEGLLTIKENTYIGNYSTIQLTPNTQVIIGKNTSISHNVRIYTSNRDPLDIINNISPIKIKTGNVIIGDNCWIGANVFICQNVTIGNNCVIGANSVVSKNIPDNSIAAGAPIKILKRKE